METRLTGSLGARRDEAQREIVFFDGDCSFCDGRVRWLRAHDRDGRFDCAPLGGALAARLLRGTGLAAVPGAPPSSLVLVRTPQARPPELWIKSRAVAAVAAQLPFPWRLGGLIALVPRFLADAAYDWVARRRHRWSRSDAASCQLTEIGSRFAEDEDLLRGGTGSGRRLPGHGGRLLGD